MAPPGSLVRPTADRVRESLFNILGSPKNQCKVLDLFAGTGALGLESLSRGAASVMFVEQNVNVCRVLQRNVHALGFEKQSTVWQKPVLKALQHLTEAYSWIFIDPPYYEGHFHAVLAFLGQPGCPLVTQNTLVVVEHPAKSTSLADPPDQVHGLLQRMDQRTYGQTSLSFYQPQGL